MEESLSPYDRLDTYLERLEAQERSRRQRLIILLAFVAVICIGGGYFAYNSFFGEPAPKDEVTNNLRRFAAEELNPEVVQQLFVKDPNPLVVIHPVTGVDTINSMDDYYQFLNRLTMLEMETEVEPMAEDPVPVNTDETPEFKVEVEGEKKVGENLTFTIENFDPTFELLLDFGNGIKRKPRRSTYTYKYPLPGHFDFHLKLVQDGEEEIIQTIKYQIFPREEQQADQSSEASERTSTSR